MQHHVITTPHLGEFSTHAQNNSTPGTVVIHRSITPNIHSTFFFDTKNLQLCRIAKRLLGTIGLSSSPRSPVTEQIRKSEYVICVVPKLNSI